MALYSGLIANHEHFWNDKSFQVYTLTLFAALIRYWTRSSEFIQEEYK